MSKVCTLIPNKLGTEQPSPLFQQLSQMTQDMGKEGRELTKQLWALALNEKVLDSLFLDERTEPTAEEFLLAFGDISDLLSPNSFANYITLTSGLSKETFSTYRDAIAAGVRVNQDYSNIIPKISQTKEGKYKVKMVLKSQKESKQFSKEVALHSLNTDIAFYMNSLGFQIEETEDLEYPGIFLPQNALSNAEGLKTAIKISLGILGLIALPEEFSHMLVEGFRNHPLMQRLMEAIGNNEESVEVILGELLYDKYYSKYNGDKEMLYKEAIARLIANNLANRYNIPESLGYISNRALDAIALNLANGNANDVDILINKANEFAKLIAEAFADSSLDLDLFDSSLLKNARPMLRVEAKATSFEKLILKAYEREAKRLKFKQLKNKEGKLVGRDLIEWETIRDLMEKKNYAKSCIKFLESVSIDCKNARIQIETLSKNLNTDESISMYKARNLAAVLNLVEDIVVAYTDVVLEMMGVDVLDDINSQLTEEDLEKIIDLAKDVFSILSTTNMVYDNVRKRLLTKYYGQYWEKDIKTNNPIFKSDVVTLLDVMESFSGDISGVSLQLNSLAAMPDPLLQLVDMAFKDLLNIRNSLIFQLLQKLGAILQEYYDATGSRDVTFCFEMKDGKPTGMLKSDRDYVKFFEDKQKIADKAKEYYKDLLETDKEAYYIKVKKAVNEWVKRNTEEVTYNVGNQKVKMRVPKGSDYPSNAIELLSDALRKYYSRMIEIKKTLDFLIPSRYKPRIGSLYRAPLKRVDAALAINDANFKTAMKAYGQKHKIISKNKLNPSLYDENSHLQTVPVTSENADGQILTEDDGLETGIVNGKYELLDFAGNPVKTIPVYYTQWLGEDMDMLDMNLANTMLAYGAMAYNYKTMNDMADIMELTKAFYADRDIVRLSGVKRVFGRFTMPKLNGEKESFESEAKIKGLETNLYRKLQGYIDTTIYGMKKKDLLFEFAGVQIDGGKMGGMLKDYFTQLALGVNMFSGLTNVNMGIMQTIINCVGNDLLTFKNLLKAHEEYAKGIPSTILEFYSDKKQTKMSLLLAMFDPEGDYYEDLDNIQHTGGAFVKAMKKTNPLFLNSMGEHYLHSITLLAMLDNKQVYQKQEDGTFKQMSLLDALTVKDVTQDGLTYKQLGVVDNLYEEDQKTEFSRKSLFRMKMKIDEANNRMHGAFSWVDKGEIHKLVVGSFLMQFRQWMVEFYRNRYQGKRINVLQGFEEEGFYTTLVQFTVGLMSDFKHLRRSYATTLSLLTPYLKKNLHKALTELSTYGALFTVLKYAGKPEKDKWYETLLLYTAYRLKTELGAAAPVPEFFQNALTIINSPVPALSYMDNVIALLRFSDIGETVESGKYAGWDKYVKTLYFDTPYVRNVGRVYDMIFEDDTSMLNIFK